MQNVLLISEKYIKANSEISDNLYGKYLMPAIRTSQTLYLRPIIGESLFDKVLSLVASGNIAQTENIAYKTLLDDYIQPYLLERVLADIIPIVSAKVANLGTVHSKDEYVENLSVTDAEKLQHLHEIKADSLCKILQQYLLDNLSLYPELDDCACNTMKANLDSAASTGIWLGGPRAYKLR